MNATIYSNGKGRTRDLLFAFCNVFLVCFYKKKKKNSTKLISLHSLHHKVPSNHAVDWWHLGKCIKFKKNGTNIKSSTHHLCQPWWLPHQGHNVTKFYLSPTHTPFSGTVIGCHVPSTHFSACWLALKLCNSLYIHHNHLIFHISAFISLTCFSLQTITQYTNCTLLDFVVINIIALL